MKNKIIIILIILLPFIVTSCSKSDSSTDSSNSETGKAGSMARFIVYKDYLYTVEDASLTISNVSNPANPVVVNSLSLSFGVETIFPSDDKLFIGTTTGMYIFDITTPNKPEQLAHYRHYYTRDPVVVSGQYAYVTLRSDNKTGRSINELQIIDISNPEMPEMARKYDMTFPKGLAVEGNELFICDDGIKVYDITYTPQVTLKYHFPEIPANDIIINNGILLVIGERGFYQYKIKEGSLEALSQIIAYPEN